MKRHRYILFAWIVFTQFGDLVSTAMARSQPQLYEANPFLANPVTHKPDLFMLLFKVIVGIVVSYLVLRYTTGRFCIVVLWLIVILYIFVDLSNFRLLLF